MNFVKINSFLIFVRRYLLNFCSSVHLKEFHERSSVSFPEPRKPVTIKLFSKNIWILKYAEKIVDK